MGVADKIITHGDPKVLLAEFGLNADGIAERAAEAHSELRESGGGKRRLRVA
jgi:hypothetical protein